ncbi:CHAT domain-containing protein [Alloacidobacterium sp.]|uniref:CHAT domain-containing protein n=1 Tax=Alloacidobacterium sp. TaxID=2951999 RepID=UPI002D599A5E|nr:CHAT domain-containing protein [Alloacidobacterium sp.]HYK37756.1 CHAT domain-containing protein [Alloacidobacterium sp.]
MDARALLREGKNSEVLSMLSQAPPFDLDGGDIALGRTVLQAWAYNSLGRDKEASQALQQAEHLSGSQVEIQDNPSPLKSQIYNAWATIYLERGDLVRADEIFRRDLEVANKRNDEYQMARTLLNLSVVALRRERFDEALDRSEAAVHVAKQINARSLLEKSQGNIAWDDYKLGNFEEALAGFRTAEQEAKTLDEVSDRMEWLNDIGLSLYRLGHLQEAENYYKSALQLAQSFQNAEREVEAHTALAELLLQQGNIPLAAQEADKALDVARSSGRNFDEMNALFLKSLIAAHQHDTAESTHILTALDKNPTITPSEHWQVEGALANVYAETSDSAVADRWYRQSIITFETQRETIKKEESKLPFSTNADQLYDDYVRFLVDHNKTNEALRWLGLGRARTLEEGLGVASPDFIAATKKMLDPVPIARRLHGTILIYSLAPQESYLWAINSSGTHFFKLPPQEEINAHVRNYQRAILASRDTLSDSSIDGIALYRILIEPAALLIPKGSPVYIIPDGSLARLNFETLLAPDGGIHYWIEDAVITNASSLKLLSAFHPEERVKNPKKLLLIGNPISPEQKFPDLPNASAEIANVARHFPSADENIFVQKQALPAAYTGSNPGQYSLIHFVAHGTSSSASPLDSAIVLTRNPSDPDSFKLYARDVIRHPLHADLVAISACYGSGSQVYGGEGIVGLSWAFLRAGAHYVIGSLWEVSDSTAPQIMDHMYSEIAAGRSPAAALRDAKLSMVHAQNVFRKPLYWATFQIYGGA